MIASIEAYPSIPSRKLYRLMNQTAPIIVTIFRISDGLISIIDISIGPIPFRIIRDNETEII
jgi:hypothetical protein